MRNNKGKWNVTVVMSFCVQQVNGVHGLQQEAFWERGDPWRGKGVVRRKANLGKYIESDRQNLANNTHSHFFCGCVQIYK